MRITTSRIVLLLCVLAGAGLMVATTGESPTDATEDPVDPIAELWDEANAGAPTEVASGTISVDSTIQEWQLMETIFTLGEETGTCMSIFSNLNANSICFADPPEDPEAEPKVLIAENPAVEAGDETFNMAMAFTAEDGTASRGASVPLESDGLTFEEGGVLDVEESPVAWSVWVPDGSELDIEE